MGQVIVEVEPVYGYGEDIENEDQMIERALLVDKELSSKTELESNTSLNIPTERNNSPKR